MTSNRFRVSLQKLDGRSSINDRWLRLRFITQGRQIDEGSTFRGWEVEKTYRIRLEWGRRRACDYPSTTTGCGHANGHRSPEQLCHPKGAKPRRG